ncbi:MAG: hypothetical protein LBH96_00830 [Candidatus Peribacteria bacterium]|jgi:hypothetical protein|nr:hypothetical protein [Candidatus Peribacteria bacterium]
MHLGLQDAYLLISQSKGGVNGDYNDFKLGGKVHDTEYDEIVGHEVSSYNESNDIDLKNHDILDLEKNIEKTIKGRKKKSVSINTLRLFTEGTIKDISYKLDMYENAIEKGEIAKPYTDDYQYMDIN